MVTMTLCYGKDGNLLRVVGPDYVHHYPSFKKTQLAAVKEKLYNPNLPTLRHEDRDNVMGKLCDEHCKTTTCCTSRDFAEAEMNAFRPPARALHCLDITKTGRDIHRMYFTTIEVQKAAKAWSEYVNQSSYEVPQFEKLYTPHDPVDLHYDGAAIRFIKPEIRNRRLTFRCESRMDPNGYHQSQPTPSDVSSRYRSAQPLYYRNVSDQPWLVTSPCAEHYDYKPYTHSVSY